MKTLPFLAVGKGEWGRGCKEENIFLPLLEKCLSNTFGLLDFEIRKHIQNNPTLIITHSTRGLYAR